MTTQYPKNTPSGGTHKVIQGLLGDPEYRAMLLEKGVEIPDAPGSDSEGSGSTIRADPSGIGSGVLYTQGGTEVLLTREALERNIQRSRTLGDSVVNAKTGKAALYVPPALRGSTMAATVREQDRMDRAVKNASVPKKLYLSGVLRDAGLQYKYGITAADLGLLGVIGSSSLEMAAAKATEMVRRTHKNTTVVCDMSEVSKARVRASIKSAYHEASVASPRREITMAYYPGTSIVSMMPGPDAVSEESAYTWELTCPTSEWITAGMLWELINAQGPYSVAAQLGKDYALLRILVTMIHTETGEAHVLSPGDQEHSGAFDTAWGILCGGDSSVLSELDSMDVGVAPVTVDDERVGTVYRVDTSWAVTTSHVLKTPDATVAGATPFTDGHVKRLSTALMAVQTEPSSEVCGDDVILRPPVVGEYVHARMVRRSDDGSVEVTRTRSAKVDEVSDLCFVPGLVTYPGMSGCVYVADVDGAVVAVHEGTKASVSVGASMVLDARALCASEVSWYSGRMPGLGCVQSPTVKTWADTNSVAYSAWVKLAGSMVVGYGGSVEYHPRQACSLDGGPSSPTELATRPPENDEVCVVVAIDSSGVYMSHELSYAELVQMSASPTNVTWWRLMRQGSVVVAVEDASVIASMWIDQAAPDKWTAVPEQEDTRAKRVTSPLLRQVSEFIDRNMLGPTVVDNRAWMQRVFPFLSSHVYNGGDIDECFTHQSYSQYQLSGNPFVGNRLLAKVGRTVMATRLMLKLRNRVGALVEADTYSVKWQSSHVKTIVAEQFQMLGQLRVSQSYQLDIAADSALIVEAMVGLVYLHETDIVLDKFIGFIAMFGDL